MFQKFCIVVFTHKDVFEARQKRSKQPISFPEWCQRQGGDLQELLRLCQNRYIVFDNLGSLQMQREELMSMIQRMKKPGERYNSELFAMAAAAQRKLIEEAKLPAISADVLQKLDLLRADLKQALASTDKGDHGGLLVKLDEIKEDARDLLENSIKAEENTSGVLDDLAAIVMDFINSVTSRTGTEETAAKLKDQDSKLRRALLKGGSIASGLLTTASVPGTAVGASTVATNPVTIAVAAGVAGGLGVAATGGLAVLYFSEKRKARRRKEIRERARQQRANRPSRFQ